MSPRPHPAAASATARLSSVRRVCAGTSPGSTTRPSESIGHAPAANTVRPSGATATYEYGTPSYNSGGLISSRVTLAVSLRGRLGSRHGPRSLSHHAGGHGLLALEDRAVGSRAGAVHADRAGLDDRRGGRRAARPPPARHVRLPRHPRRARAPRA